MSLSPLLMQQLPFMRRQALLVVDREGSHSDCQQQEADHHQIAEDAYSATGIGRGSSCSPVLKGRRRIPAFEATTNSRRPISGGMARRDEGRQGKWRLGAVL